MNKEEFKKIVANCLKKNGFCKYKTWFYLDLDELFIGVKIVRSYYSDMYYLDYGVFVKSRWNNEEYRQTDPHKAEIRSRVGFCELEKHESSQYEAMLDKRLKEIFLPLEIDGERKLRKRIKSKPEDYILIMPLEERKNWSPIWK